MPAILETAPTEPMALLSALSEPDRAAFAHLHALVSSDWGPRDAYEQRWVLELVTSMWRQDQLRALDLATLTAAAAESPPSDATVRKLDTFARYGARIDKDMAKAPQALRSLRDRPDAWIDEGRNDTCEPGQAGAHQRSRTSGSPPRTREPEPPTAAAVACTREPELPLNRQQRRALAAMARKRAA